MRGFRMAAGARATPEGSETFRTIRDGQFENCEIGVISEINFFAKLS